MTQWKRIHFIEQIIAGDLSIQAAYDISSWNTWYWWFLPLSNLKVDCYNCMTSKITNVSRKENPTAESISSTKAEEEVLGLQESQWKDLSGSLFAWLQPLSGVWTLAPRVDAQPWILSSSIEIPHFMSL